MVELIKFSRLPKTIVSTFFSKKSSQGCKFPNTFNIRPRCQVSTIGNALPSGNDVGCSYFLSRTLHQRLSFDQRTLRCLSSFTTNEVKTSNASSIGMNLSHHNRFFSTVLHSPQPSSQTQQSNDAKAKSVQDVSESLPRMEVKLTSSSSVYSSKSSIDLIRSLIVFRLCQVPWLVQNAEWILSTISYRSVVGKKLTNVLLKHTFFEQFCAGEDEKSIQPKVLKLNSAGIGTILDYAAEAPLVQRNENIENCQISNVHSADLRSRYKFTPNYYESHDLEYDGNVQNFLQCIEACGSSVSKSTSGNKTAYMAVKVTALGNPLLLERISDAIRTVRNNHMNKKDLQNMIEQSLNENELDMMKKLYNRAHKVAQAASLKKGVRLLIDAEQNKYQPAIDELVLNLQQIYNHSKITDYPVVYNTYQCYLKDSFKRIQIDFERSKKHQFHFGVKLVRGAYMEYERKLALEEKNSSPVFETVGGTHDNYNQVVKYLLEKRKHDPVGNNGMEIMLATHNKESIELTLRLMHDAGINRSSNAVTFAQLYGMVDYLTYNLSFHGYSVYKYIPYGPVETVMPYLIRRANENSSITATTIEEMNSIIQEIRRRISL